MSGYFVAGTDLDVLLEPWRAGDPFAASTGFAVAGADLNQRYAPASVGAASTAVTGYRQAGIEVAARFASAGSRTLLNPQQYGGAAYEALASGVSAPTTAFVDFRLNSDGTWRVQTQAAVIASGQWLGTVSAGAGAGYEVQFTVTADPAITVTNGASAFAVLSIGRAVNLKVTVNQQLALGGNATVIVAIRPVGGSAVSSTFTAAVSAEIS